MVWFKVDDTFYDHSKVFELPDAAVALWTRAGCWSARNLTDGFVPAKLPARLCDDPDTGIRALVDHGLWKRTRGGWQFRAELPGVHGGVPLPLCEWVVGDYRRKISAGIRQAVMERDEFRCVECGVTNDLTLDHIHPYSKGGEDTEENLRVLCRSCNSRKGARLL